MKILPLFFFITILPGSLFSKDKGAPLFENKCGECHFTETGKKDADHEAPNLAGIFQRELGGDKGYNYSDLFKSLSKKIPKWDDNFLNEYISDPKKFFKKYGEGDIKNPEHRVKIGRGSDREEIVKYLKKTTLIQVPEAENSESPIGKTLSEESKIEKVLKNGAPDKGVKNKTN